MLQHTPTEQEHRFIRQHHRMPGYEPWRISLSVDVRGHNAVEIAPSNHEAEGDAPFVDAFDVVGGPGDGVADAGVDAKCTEEDAGVLNVWIGLICCQYSRIVSAQMTVWPRPDRDLRR